MIHRYTLDHTRKILKGVACGLRDYASARTHSYSGGGANVNHIVQGGGDPVPTQAFHVTKRSATTSEQPSARGNPRKCVSFLLHGSYRSAF